MSLFGDVIGFISSGRAAKAAANGYGNAISGIGQATNTASGAVQDAFAQGERRVQQAGENLTNTATAANGNLQSVLKGINENVAPYMGSGVQGNQMLQDYAASNPQFKFSVDDYFNSPAYNFQLQQGTDAIGNKMSTTGITGGNTFKAMEDYRQGLASTYYNQAFNQAQSQFQTNNQATMANIQALLNAGQFGTGLSTQANENIAGLQNQNTMGAANTNANLASLLASLGLQAGTTTANYTMRGAEDAGNWAVGQGTATGAGILSQGNALAGIGSDIGSLLSGLGLKGTAGKVIGGVFGGGK